MNKFQIYYYIVESKKYDSDQPFVLVTTYNTPANRIERPIKCALEEFKNTTTMLEFLAFIDEQKIKDTLVSKLIEENTFFQPSFISFDETLRFLKELNTYKDSGVKCRLPKWEKSKTIKIQPTFEKNKTNLGIMSFNASVVIDEHKISLEDLQEIVRNNIGLLYVKNKWVNLDLMQLANTLKIIEDLKRTLEESKTNELKKTLEKIEKAAEKDNIELPNSNSWWLQILESRLQNSIDCDIDLTGFNGLLKPYQVVGCHWLAGMYNLELGAILGDDQGLGKTITTISFLQSLKNQNKPHKTLLVVPASLIGNWKKELTQFAPNIKTYIVHSSYSNSLTKTGIKDFNSYEVFIATYDGIQRYPWILNEEWDITILDEAHNIKNLKAKRTEAARSIQSKFRLAISGTPVENKIDDLFSILDFLNPDLYGTLSDFKKLSKSNLEAIRKITECFILRRTKGDENVISLPAKKIIDVPVDLSIKQCAFYENIIEKIKKKEMLVFSSLTHLKQICNHPSQYLGSEDYQVEDSGKFQHLLKIAQEVNERGEKLIVFTQFVEVIQPLVNLLNTVFKKKGEIIDGKVAPAKRSKIVEEFQHGCYDFLVCSTKAANTGLTLTAANNLVFFDLVWAPSTMNQAMDRIHRISQTKDCNIYRLITKGTLEEGIIELLKAKQELFDSIIPKNQEAVITKEFIEVFKKNLLVA